MNTEEQKRERKKILENKLKNNFKIDFVSDIPNIDSPLLLILDYSPRDEDLQLVSFAFSLLKYYKGSDSDFSNQFWSTRNVQHPERTHTQTPHAHSAYKKFTYKENDFLPFSATLNRYNFLSLEKMKELLCSLYQTIDFS